MLKYGTRTMKKITSVVLHVALPVLALIHNRHPQVIIKTVHLNS